MKKIIISLSTLLCGAVLVAQDAGQEAIASGKIIYEERVRLDIKIEGDASAYSGMLPKEQVSVKELLFNEGTTLFSESKKSNSDITMGQGEGVHIRMMSSGEDRIYTDFNEGKVTEQRDFMNRRFLIEREIPDSRWKITGQQKEIIGYRCMEAVSVDTSGKATVVWFSPDFGAKGGPGLFNNLPGMVLEVNMNDGARVFIATKVESMEPGTVKPQKPGEGKRVTEEEFRTIVSEKMKEMNLEEGQSDGGGEIRIVIKG